MSNLNLPEKTKLINFGILTGFIVILLGFFVEIKGLDPIGFLILGLIFVIFHREVAVERFRIDTETKNEFLKKYLFSSETLERNSFVVLIVGIGFLIAGALTAAAVFLG